ncbi:MAG: AarF/ABC1/UbiB kinase family protein, partial [Chitinivibrionales bacterium]|nr:AarF/ABC1/UbiB kinase family protein [Chitinivibrionales bacterium]MBD3356687.1 AarF/ABC1/UbiB kinase family protein [Chitinivibrionales bacterium]
MTTTPFRKRRRGAVHLGRLGEILSVLVKYGFGDILETFHIEKYVAITRQIFRRGPKTPEIAKVSRWERVRMALEELGPTFVKFGQFMSNRPDLLPSELIVELERLQDDATPFSVKEARDIVEKEMGRPIESFMESFSEKPIASASIAQVHTGRLRDGSKVAVKIQRPRIKQTLSIDIDILRFLASLAERRDERFRTFHVTQLVDEFERVLTKELDFQVEATHMERFRGEFLRDKDVHVPEVYSQFTTRKVLVTEFINGIKVSDVETLEKVGIDRKDLARRGADVVLRQVFEHGFFHADPHPGNILVLHNGEICFLDFGAVGIVPSSLRQHLSTILYGVVNRDSQKIVRTLSLLSHGRVSDLERLEYDVTEFMEEYSLTSLSEINVGDALSRFANLIVNHGLRIVPGFYILLKALITIENVGYRLDPDFKLSDHLKPHVRRLLRESLRLHHIPYDAYTSLVDLTGLIRDLPFDLKDIVRIIRAGDLRIQFEHRGLEPLMARHVEVMNRLAFAVVVAALIVGSSVIVYSGIPPLFYEIPVIGIIGFLMAAVVGFGLLFSM